MLHLVLDTGHLAWDVLAVAGEIANRLYFTLGFVVLLGLGVLGWTSTDGWQARLGRRWKRRHRLIYAMAALAVLHAFLQSKSRADDAVLMARASAFGAVAGRCDGAGGACAGGGNRRRAV